VIPTVYLVAIAIGTTVLMLPASTASRRSPQLIDAAFTAVSAICITGLVTVDTPTFWSPFGQVVILLLIQIGGFGIVTLGTLLAMVALGRISLHGSLLASRELQQRSLADTLRLPGRIALVMLIVEGITAIALTLAFRPYTDTWGLAAWHGVFHSVSAFNNAGFALYTDNLIGFAGDPAIIVPICVAIIVGGIGFPVLFEIVRRWRRRGRSHWSAHTRLTVYGTVALLVAGTLVFAAAEWNNPETLGALPVADRVLASVAGGVFPRTAGFNSIDYGAASETTLGLYYVLMFIGGGSAGTAGGIKVGTIGVIVATVAAELRGEDQAIVAHRAIPPGVQRSALAVVTLGLTTVALGTAFIVGVERLPLQQILFETVSAFGTVGLSTGITASLQPASLVMLMILMYLGRVGIISAATALAVRARHRRYRLPEEQPIVG